jgi:hypothetical protein
MSSTVISLSQQSFACRVRRPRHALPRSECEFLGKWSMAQSGIQRSLKYSSPLTADPVCADREPPSSVRHNCRQFFRIRWRL